MGRLKADFGPGSPDIRGRWSAAVLSALLVAGCSSTTPSAPPAVATPVAVAAVASPGPTSTPMVTPLASSTPRPTPSPTPVPTPRPTASAWKEVPSQASVRNLQLLDVVWTGSRFIAAGDRAVLDSTDGATWHRQKSEVGNDGWTHLASGPGGVVAVGGTASWTSPDGRNWVAHAKAFRIPDIGSDSVVVTDVVTASRGWVAVGRQDPACSLGCGTHIRALVWTSDDGAHWTRVADQKSFAGGGMEAVARGKDGFIAVGSASDGAVIWTSPDGQRWSRVPDAKMFHGPSGSGLHATGVAVRDGNAVVVGQTGEYEPSSVRAWWSADGVTWSKAAVERGTGGQMFAVASTIDGFLAVGPSGRDSCLGGIWASTDGHAWRCVASQRRFDGFGPYAVAASDTVEVAVGLTDAGSPDGLPGAIFTRTWH